MKFLITFLVSIVLSPSIAGAADLPEEQWSIMTNLFSKSADVTGVALLGISIEDNSNISEQVSTLVGKLDTRTATVSTLRICQSIDDQYCGANKAQYFTSILPNCKTEAETNCIAGLVAVKDGKELSASYVRNFPEKGYTDFPSSVANNLPQGSTPSLWNFADLKHGGGTSQYMVNFVLRGNFNGDNKAQFNSYEAAIYPVSIKSGNYGRNEARDSRYFTGTDCNPNSGCGMSMMGHSGEDKFICASLEDGACAIREKFPENVRFKVVARLSQSPTGWFHGRLKSPDVVLTPNGTGVTISVEAEPVTVPVVGILEDYSKLPAAMQEKYKDPQSFQWGNGLATGRNNKLMMPSPSSQEAFDLILDWKDYIKDKANASPTEWAVRTLPMSGVMSSCLRSTTQLVGIVTTNSMVYLGSPPTFNTESQSLDYKVASPHYTSKGEVFKGTYDLQLKSDVARCLYGFSNAPISATISIINDSGDAAIATTLLSEKDGWLRLAAYGFTFSNPTLRVKLTQEDSPTKTKRTSITCVKGKTSKKVTAVSPKCPSGYKKK